MTSAPDAPTRVGRDGSAGATRGATGRLVGVEQEDQKISSGDGSDRLIGAFIEVHGTLGPGLLEAAYEACLCRELQLNGFWFERQIPIEVVYKGETIDCAFCIDVLVERRFMVELKAVEALLPVHSAQVLTYMKLANIPVGFLVNFNVPSLRRGLKRLSLRAPIASTPQPF